MNDLLCPKDQAAMRSIERNGVTIERCSECGGVFLDRGELERLMQAETAYTARGYRDDDDDDFDGRRGRSDDSYDRQQPGKRKKRGGFLSDLLDFG
jgi:Zn-finger nucleic acid-binding protein